MQVTRRAHFDNVCIKPWRNNKGTAVGAFDVVGASEDWTGRARLKCAVLTDSFQLWN